MTQREALRQVLEETLGHELELVPSEHPERRHSPVLIKYVVIGEFMEDDATAVVRYDSNAGGSALAPWEASGLLIQQLVEVLRARNCP